MMISGRKSRDQLDLALGHAARHRHHGAAEPLGAVMGAQAAREQAVAVDDVHQIARAPAGGPDRARADFGPDFDVGPGVADHGRLTGGAGRGVDAQDLRAGHGEHPERVMPTQVVLGREREFPEVSKPAQVVRMDARPIERRPVMGNPLVDPAQRRLEAAELQRLDLVAGRDLDRVELVALGRARRHGPRLRRRPGRSRPRPGSRTRCRGTARPWRHRRRSPRRHRPRSGRPGCARVRSRSGRRPGARVR